MGSSISRRMLKRFTYLPASITAVLLAACLVAAYLTRNSGSVAHDTNGQAASAAPQKPVDDRLMHTARRLAASADTPDEQVLVQEALRLADHELDQAFATALREAAATAAPASGPLKQLSDRVAQVKARMAADQARIAKLTKDAATSESADDQLQLAKAQLALDQDELEDAQQDLARHGGDQHAKIESAREEHETAQKEPVRLPKTMAVPSTTLAGHVQSWLALEDRQEQVEAARQQAAGKAASLGRQHDTLAKLMKEGPPPGVAGAQNWSVVDELFDADEEDPATMIDRLRGLSEKTKTLAELGKRTRDTQQLADVYRRWGGVIDARRRGVLHLMLSSLALALSVFLVTLVISRALRRAFDRQMDRRRLHQLRVMSSIAVQFVGVLLILLVVFGPPSQLSTVIGLATAGLTVALKDFIVAFFGWFTLMGKNGLRVGDWVEIEGVSGEVIEIGLLRTVLLEMGNWTDTGHPTGRRVAFVNSFAIEGHYFNFSTAGQWLWDEVQVTLPASGDPHQLAGQIREAVESATLADASAAEQDWERVTRQYGIRPFSAKPAVDLRPASHGLDVIVRYITRAPQRHHVKTKILESIVDVLHKPVPATAG